MTLGNSFFEIIKYVTHPISLVAYVSALITYFFISRNINERKKLEGNPEAYQKIAERLKLDFELIPESERGIITLKVLKNRIYSQLIIAISIIIGGLIIAYLFINYIHQTGTNQNEIDKRKTEQNFKDSISEQQRQDSTNEPAVINRENKNTREGGKDKNNLASIMEIEKQICAAKSYVENQQYNNAINIYESIRKHFPNYFISYDLKDIDSYLEKKDIEKASKEYCKLLSNLKCK